MCLSLSVASQLLVQSSKALENTSALLSRVAASCLSLKLISSYVAPDPHLSLVSAPAESRKAGRLEREEPFEHLVL